MFVGALSEDACEHIAQSLHLQKPQWFLLCSTLQKDAHVANVVSPALPLLQALLGLLELLKPRDADRRSSSTVEDHGHGMPSGSEHGPRPRPPPHTPGTREPARPSKVN